MRKKKKEIIPPPVETDFYAEALKAFDVVLPPSEEELEAQRQAEAERVRKRTRRRRAALLAVLAVTVALLLWRPWDSSVEDPIIDEPAVNIPLPPEIKLGFHVYAVPGHTDPADTGYTGAWDFDGGQADALVKQLEQLKWFPTVLMSAVPPAPIGDITILRDGQAFTVGFNASGTLFAEGYMTNPDGTVWDDIFDLLLRMNTVTQTGRFSTELTDGSVLELNILVDGSFAAIADQSILYRGYWGRVGEYLLLYTDDPKVGLATLKVGNGVMRYLDKNNSWLLKELKGGGFLYHKSVNQQTAAAITLKLSMPGSDTAKTAVAKLNALQRDQLYNLLNNAQWTSAVITGSMPQFCGSVNLSEKTSDGLTQTASIQFSHDGVLYNGGMQYAIMSEEDWMTFLELLSLAGAKEVALRQFTQDSAADPIFLQFTLDGRFEYRDESAAVIGNYLQLGDVVLLAGTNGLREILHWNRDTGDLTTQTGEVLHQIPILYGVTYPVQ